MQGNRHLDLVLGKRPGELMLGNRPRNPVLGNKPGDPVLGNRPRDPISVKTSIIYVTSRSNLIHACRSGAGKYPEIYMAWKMCI